MLCRRGHVREHRSVTEVHGRVMITEQGTPQPAHSLTGRGRPLVIAAVVVLAVAIGAVLGSALVTRAGASLSRSASYVPGDAVIYAELRLDLPGQQRANLQAILDRFPAINADEVLGDALAETLDQALARGGAPFDYTNDVAPWFDGVVGLALLDYPLASDPMQMQLPGLLASFGVRDASAATRLADTLRTEMESQGASFSSSEHAGVTIWSLTVDTAELAPFTNAGFAYAVTDDQLLLASGKLPVERALDAAGDGDSLADADEVNRLLAALPDERAGVAVVNSAAMMAAMRSELEATQPDMAAALAPYLDAVPPVTVGTMSFAGDAVLFEEVAGLPEGAAAPENATRDLAGMVPADAILYADGGKVGVTLEQAMAGIRAVAAAGPQGDQQLQTLEQVEAALGADLEELVSWIGSGAFAVGWDGDLVYAGAVLEATDPDAAERRLGQLRALAELAASDPSSGITVSTETVSGVKVTTIAMAYRGAPTFDVPFAPAIQYAVDGDRVLIGVGDRFVGNALAQDPATSLASSDRYTSAVARFGGPNNAGTFFLDLAALRQAVEGAMGVDDEPMYATVRPNLEPFDYLAGVSRAENGRAVSRMGLVLR